MGKQIKFTKMHGLGNDFMVIDAINQHFMLNATLIQQWATRHFGVGFDQLLLVENSTRVDFKYRIFNADGLEVEQCGNGARCFAKFIFEKGLTKKKEITVETNSGIINLTLIDETLVKVNMGLANFLPTSLPFLIVDEQTFYPLKVGDETFSIGVVSIGNPHAVIKVSDVSLAPVEKVGKLIESHSLFPERVNVGFAQIVSPSQIKLRVYERGAAETLACGTGACAAMVVFRQRQEVADKVTVSLPGGDLLIEWNGKEKSPVIMTGPATTVFEGVISF
jgi:diaminopimelate epimerase